MASPESDQTPVAAARVSALPVALTAVIGLLYAALFLSVFRQMAGQWYDDPNYSHGFVVPAVSAYLIWERRGQLHGLPLVPSVGGAVLLVGGLGLLLLGMLGSELFLQRVSTVVVLAALVWLLLGFAYLAKLAFPLAFLLFYVPLPTLIVNQIAFPLQLFAAKCAVWTLGVFAVPVLREGNIIHLAGTTLEVAEACSGIRSLQALVALAIPIAIFVNALRVSGTGLIAQHYGVELAEGFYHSFAGWLVFVGAFAVLFGANWALHRLPPRDSKDAAGERADPPPEGGTT